MIAGRREYITRHVEYTLPSGSPVGELEKAIRAATAEYRKLNQIAEGRPGYDDWLRVEARDDEVVICFQAEAAGGAR